MHYMYKLELFLVIILTILFSSPFSFSQEKSSSQSKAQIQEKEFIVIEQPKKMISKDKDMALPNDI